MGLRTTIKLAFMLTTVINKEVVKIKASFLTWWAINIQLSNGFYY